MSQPSSSASAVITRAHALHHALTVAFPRVVDLKESVVAAISGAQRKKLCELLDKNLVSAYHLVFLPSAERFFDLGPPVQYPS